MSSAAAVLRSAACCVLRRPPPFPRAQSSNMRQRFYSSGNRTTAIVGKAAQPTSNYYDGVSDKVEKLNSAFSDRNAALKELAELMKEKVERDRRTMVLRRRIVLVGGVLAAVYVKRRFFSGGTGTKEDNDKEVEMETANI